MHHNWLFTKYFWPFLIALILATLFSVLLFCFALLSKEKDEVVTGNGNYHPSTWNFFQKHGVTTNNHAEGKTLFSILFLYYQTLMNQD